LPSLLDYGAASRNLVTESKIHWHGVPADHALVTYSISPVRTMMRNTKTNWKCKDEEQCLSWIQANAPTEFVDLGSFHRFIMSMQTRWADTETCKRRHEARLPPDLRLLYAQVAEARDEQQRRHLQKIAWNKRKQWFLELGSRRLCEKVCKGRVLERSKKLFELEAMVLSDVHPGRVGAISSSCEDWSLEVESQFSKKWGVSRLQDRVNILDAVLMNDGSGISITPASLMEAFDHIKCKARVDHYGISIAAVKMVAIAQPGLVVDFLSLAAASTAIMSSIVVKGRVFGKESCTAPATSLRSILPLPAVMQILDVLIPSCLERHVRELLPSVPECFVGAVPGTQCLDIAHGLQSVIEKGLDNFGAAAIAQSDIEKFYDSLPILRIMRWLTSRGVPANAAACAVRHQMCPTVVLKVGSSEVKIGGRTVGGMTGSRTAGFLGRIPVEAIIADRRSHWRPHGFRTDSSPLCLCTWVDNLFSASDSLAGALYILDDFESQLQQHWHMNIKRSSRCCMVSDGNLDIPEDVDRWPLVDTFIVLGHAVQSSGSIRACWARARSTMWKAFWVNPGATSAAQLAHDKKLALMSRAVLPQLSFRCSRWPPQRQIASELDNLQQKMTASLLRLPPAPGEEAEDYVRRRGRAARKICTEQGMWSNHWFGRATRWDEHLARPRNWKSWPARLREYRGRQWLIERRAHFAPSVASRSSTASVFAGRTGTRSFRGKVHTRWHDGIDFARSRSTS